MKIRLLSIIILLFTFSCTDAEDEMPNQMSEVCTESFSFIENGSTVTFPLLDLGNGPKASFILKDPSPFGTDKVSRLLSIRGQSGLTVFDIVLEIVVDDANACIPEGLYDINTLDSRSGIMSVTYTEGFNSFIAGLGVGSAQLEITDCDFENKMISGTFNCVLGQAFGTETTNITSGQFTNICLSI